MNGVRNNANRNQQGQRNAGPQRNAVQQPQPNNGPRPVEHPQTHLKIEKGVVSSFTSRYMFSQKAIDCLKGHFRGLLVDNTKTDKPRFNVGGKQGFEVHGHALGATLRSHFHDLIVEKYQPRGNILEFGGSPVRAMARYGDNGEQQAPWMSRVHMMNPRIGAQDALRDAEHPWSVHPMVLSHNKREKEIRPVVTEQLIYSMSDPEDVHSLRETVDTDSRAPICKHLAGPDMHLNLQKKADGSNCECNDLYEAVVSVESWYYPGVVEGMFNKLASSHHSGRKSVAGYFVGNDYYRFLKRKLTDVTSKFYSETINHMIAADFEKITTIGYGCENHDGVPESSHHIYSAHEDVLTLKVRADVKDNPIPYIHGFPLTADRDSYRTPYTLILADKTEINYQMLVVKKEEVVNGDIPFVLLKITPILTSLWTKEQLESVVEVPLRMARVIDLAQDMIGPVQETQRVKLEEEEKRKQAALSLAKKQPRPTIDVEEPVFYFDEEKYNKKCHQKGDTRYDPNKMKRKHENNIAFVRWLGQQFGDRNVTHRFYIRYIDDEAFLVAKLLSRSWWGLFIKENSSDTAMARLTDVVDAYIEIGIKSSANAIQQTLVQKQRGMAEEDRDHEMLTMQEAYTIARLLRSLENSRMIRLLKID